MQAPPCEFKSSQESWRWWRIPATQIHSGGQGVFASLSLGEKGAPKNIPVKQYGEMQRAATEKAAKMLGAEAVLLTFSDAEIPRGRQGELRRMRPDPPVQA